MSIVERPGSQKLSNGELENGRVEEGEQLKAS